MTFVTTSPKVLAQVNWSDDPPTLVALDRLPTLVADVLPETIKVDNQRPAVASAAATSELTA